MYQRVTSDFTPEKKFRPAILIELTSAISPTFYITPTYSPNVTFPIVLVVLIVTSLESGRMAGVISMSGSATSPFAIDPDAKDAAKNLAEKNGCPTSPVLAMAKCLQTLPVEKLVKADSAIEV